MTALVTREANSELFLRAFSQIEKWLRSQVGTHRSDRFYELVDRAARRNPIVQRYQVDLKEFADLRNAIVHERTDDHVIAEPNDRALADLHRAKTNLLNPPCVVPKFQKTVCVLPLNASVGQAAIAMRDGSFSQIPILEGSKVVALLTAETIVRWVASEFANELVVPWETPIKDALVHTENADHYDIVPRRATLHDTLSLFEKFASRGQDLDAILISQDGKREQRLLGIVTLYDLPEILKELGLKRISAVGARREDAL